MSKLSFPSSIILSVIKEKHIYKDERSFEKSTNVTKRKFKLATRWPDSLKSQNIRIFFVSTSSPYSVRRRTSVRITKKDYTICKAKQLLNGASYYDLTKKEVLSGEEVKSKMNDPANGFEDVAEISDTAFGKFLEKTRKLKLEVKPPISVIDIRQIAESVSSQEVSDQFLKELHII